jgi:hypothetical protein
MTLFIKFANGIPEDWKANPSQFESILRRAAGPGMTTYKVNPMGTTATVNFSTKVRHEKTSKDMRPQYKSTTVPFIDDWIFICFRKRQSLRRRS